jgi:hypothetical protein
LGSVVHSVATGTVDCNLSVFTLVTPHTMQPLQKYALASFLSFAFSQEEAPYSIKQVAQDYSGPLSDERSNKARAALKKELEIIESEGSTRVCSDLCVRK